MSNQSGWGVLFFTVTVSQLKGCVTIFIFCADLGHYTRTELDNGAGYVFACRVIHTGHTDFFSNQTVHVALIYLVIERCLSIVIYKDVKKNQMEPMLRARKKASFRETGTAFDLISYS
jgi:hypothetical protein